MGIKIKVQTNTADIIAKIQAGKAAMIPAVAEQALADCNYFARQDQNILRASAATNSNISGEYPPKSSATPEELEILNSAEGSDIPKGNLVWDTPYAKKVYYTGTPSKDNNPNASLMWCEKAQAEFGKDWEKIAQKSFEKGMKQT